MRQFYLRSGSVIRPLNGESKIYTRDPSGLGCSASAAFSSISDGVFVPSYTQSQQDTLGLTLVFTGKQPYADYRTFVDWLASAKNLELGYAPDGDIFWRPIMLRTILKTERSPVGWLEVPVTFWALAPWQRDDAQEYTVNLTAVKEQTLPLAKLPSMPSPMRLSLLAPPEGVEIRIVGDASRTVYSTIRLLDAAGIGSLSLDTTPGSQSVTGTVGSLAADILPKLDISGKPFALIPSEESCSLVISAQSPMSGLLLVSVYPYYRSV